MVRPIFSDKESKPVKLTSNGTENVVWPQICKINRLKTAMLLLENTDLLQISPEGVDFLPCGCLLSSYSPLSGKLDFYLKSLAFRKLCLYNKSHATN